MLSINQIKKLDILVTLGLTEIKAILKLIQDDHVVEYAEIKQLLAKINPMIFHRLESITLYRQIFVHNGNLLAHAEYVMNARIQEVKKADVRRKRELEKREVMLFLKTNIEQIRHVLEIQKILINLKSKLLN